jgi:hypothetical protein
MNPRGPAINPQDVEEHWRSCLADAKASYEAAVARFRVASEDFRSRHTPSPDGGFNVHLAIAAESRARKEYMRVLRVFTDLVVYGKVPDETESRAKARE